MMFFSRAVTTHSFICTIILEKRNELQNMEADIFPRIFWVSGHTYQMTVSEYLGLCTAGIRR